MLSFFFSDKSGGYLCEDFQGFTRTIFLENGFLDFLNKVFPNSVLLVGAYRI